MEIGEWEAGSKALAIQHRDGEAENAREPKTQHGARVESRVGAKESGGQIQEQALSEETTASHFKTKERLESLDLKSQKTEWKNGTCKQTHRGQSMADKKERQECGAVRQE